MNALRGRCSTSLEGVGAFTRVTGIGSRTLFFFGPPKHTTSSQRVNRLSGLPPPWQHGGVIAICGGLAPLLR